MIRYGLRNLAESNLLDLIASVKHHGRRLQRIRWFGHFTGERDKEASQVENASSPRVLLAYACRLQRTRWFGHLTGEREMNF